MIENSAVKVIFVDFTFACPSTDNRFSEFNLASVNSWNDNYTCGMTVTLVETDCGNPAAGETSGIAQA